MTTNTETISEITIPHARLAFPDLFVPSAYNESAPKQYGAVLLIPKDAAFLDKVRSVYQATAEAKWGKGAAAVLQRIENDTQKNCFLDGDLKDNLDGYADHFYINAKNKKAPAVVDRDASQLNESSGKPYAGCFVLAKLSFWAQQNTHGKAMRASLLGVQFLEDGDSFTAGRVATAGEFEDLSAVGEDDIL